MPNPAPSYCIDSNTFAADCTTIAGWAFVPGRRIVSVQAVLHPNVTTDLTGFGLDSADVEAVHGPDAAGSRFQLQIAAHTIDDLELIFKLDDGDSFRITDPQPDPGAPVITHFLEALRALPSGRVLELGARNRSGTIRRDWVPAHLEYVGGDIKAGENVDVICDAHSLSKTFRRGEFVAAYSVSVFEHLVMPWKAVLELNHVLKTGGFLMIATHQTWPIHEVPWDYFRFSDQAWRGLLNRHTGFEIIEAAMGELASIVPRKTNPHTETLHEHPAYLASSVFARKIGKTRLKWKVDPTDIIDTTYPE